MVLTGLTTCLNLLLLASASLCGTVTTGLGWSDRNERRWWKLGMPCHRCQKHVTFQSGIICANYGHTRGTSHQCQGAWCADCFVAHPLDKFKTTVPRDFYGASLAELEDEVRFRKARPGDHLCTAFQCPGCQSHNIRNQGLCPEDADDAAFEAICIRATLYAFWSKSSKTVASHVPEVRFILRYSDMLGIINPFRDLDHFQNSITLRCYRPLWS